ncbi:hypothetical protein Salat_0724000 [Sesamum alatum]|uniref:Uncharacterized protein n=1 Tax=Sesamum alatum TaxID=300844 RepID=A0AAE2CV38_9LAMI|nr:hypothetical protein Salat_0724000 [Sesamum alatum]
MATNRPKSDPNQTQNSPDAGIEKGLKQGLQNWPEHEQLQLKPNTKCSSSDRNRPGKAGKHREVWNKIVQNLPSWKQQLVTCSANTKLRPAAAGRTTTSRLLGEAETETTTEVRSQRLNQRQNSFKPPRESPGKRRNIK